MNNLSQGQLVQLSVNYEKMNCVYEEFNLMKQVIQFQQDLDHNERSLLAYASDTILRQKIVTLDQLKELEKQSEFSNINKKKYFDSYKQTVIDELFKLFKEIQEVLDHLLSKENLKISSKVFYLRLKGRYHKYLANCIEQEDLKNLSIYCAFLFLSQSFELAQSLRPCHYYRWAIGVSFSNFHYDYFNDLEKAYRIAKQTFEDMINICFYLDCNSDYKLTDLENTIKNNYEFYKEKFEQADKNQQIQINHLIF
ncbi:14-3-3 family protein 14-3-3 beta/zeta (macronuclear) [Tetrahymena thermophila SB210]|uniref:14-3-3 family protein 14-3-3 beta/zeta n=1 Tax=Tetrahymena thermophila (strain SB210) TaxID=312017 RepID=I7LVM0_TETTS|nr:14-3-3 family protein 14-3-3 beta/zeta [Tetrahymena thermophila SB210]EAR98484.2 14-3-3 family protein 14-3-3 beta/zeta [Tetrahymena thermophila SB210]|eukprot:XP_001018729.2 14-3-3 family protein 14-3-3 beta/zeta [Tetrahymena thermophila SB210]